VSDLILWVALSLTEHVGSKTLLALLRHFDHDPAAALHADTDQLRQVPGIGPRIARSIQAIDLAQVEQQMRTWQDHGITVLPLNDPAYPAHLRAVDDPPATLFVRGHLPSQPGVAIVGTRAPSAFAAAAATRLGQQVAAAGLPVISGLARGIDTAAHIGALTTPGGLTLAVLGSGVLNVYPPENRHLARRCAQQGALLAEVHPSAEPSSPRLVARNRIISGLSAALVVVETDADGGAMHAARFAQRQGRPVYTLDLPASGNQALLAAGALPIAPDFQTIDSFLPIP
jgi:DNA processing protein